MSDATKAVFLSYASQDAEAAKRVCDALRAAGVEVWFDQSELVGGDAWDAKIRKQIKECALFVPVISAATQARSEGYFRLEWHLAEQRSLLIARGRPFIVPVSIDETRDSDALAPDAFLSVQWMRLAGGETTPAFCERVKQLLAGEHGARSREQGGPRMEPAAAHPIAPLGPKKSKPVWLWIVLALIAAGAAYFIFQSRRGLGERARPIAETPPITAGPAASPARQLVDRASVILNQGSLTRAQLDAAGELCDRALQLDTTDAIVWARAAATDLELIYPYGYDQSDVRRRRAQERAARATSLGPDLVEVRVVQATVFAHAVGTPALLAEAEKTLRELIPGHPEVPKLTFQLAEVLRAQNRFDEAARLFESVGEFEVAGWSYHQAGELRLALAAVERSLRDRRSVTALQLKALLQVNAKEDLAAAQATVDQLQPSELLSEMPGAMAMQVARYRRDPERILQIAQGLAAPYLDSNAFRGPRGYFTGLAHEMAGRPGRAESDWRAALAVVETRLKSAPDSRELLLWSAWLHAALNDPAEAEALFARSQAIAGLAADTMDTANVNALLRLRKKEALLEGCAALLQARPPQWEWTHAAMRFNPEGDFMRDDPRFQKLLRENLPDGAKPFDDPKPVIALTTRDEKSVAVLAFANLSDDKNNEYFSDGISEELLNVLAKIPGLKVSARTSAFYFKGKEVPIPEIAKQLGVAYVVEGSVRKSGDKVRITAQLIKASDGFHVWSDTFTRDMKDIFAVQDEIAGLIAQNLRAKMAISRERSVVTPEAYALVLQARHAAARQTIEGGREAVKIYREVLALAPDEVDAWAELAYAYQYLARFGGMDTSEGMREARLAARKALELDPEQPLGLAAFGWVQRTDDHDWRGAVQSFRHALAVAPENAAIMSDAAICFLNVGLADEALVLANRAAERDPLNPKAHWSLGIVMAFAGKMVQAEAPYRRAVELAPAADEYHSHLARVLTVLNRLDEAKAVALAEPSERYRISTLAGICYRAGDKAAAESLMAELIAKYGGSMAGYIAAIYAQAGYRDEAFKWLERGYETRDAAIAWVKTSDYLRSLHDDPRWPVFLHKMGLADDQLK